MYMYVLCVAGKYSTLEQHQDWYSTCTFTHVHLYVPVPVHIHCVVVFPQETCWLVARDFYFIMGVMSIGLNWPTTGVLLHFVT